MAKKGIVAHWLFYVCAACLGGMYGHYLAGQQFFIPEQSFIRYYLWGVCVLVPICCLIYYWLDEFGFWGWFIGGVFGIPLYTVIVLVALALLSTIISIPLTLGGGNIPGKVLTILTGGIVALVLAGGVDLFRVSLMDLARKKNKKYLRANPNPRLKLETLLENTFQHLDNRLSALGETLLSDEQLGKEETARVSKRFDLSMQMSQNIFILWTYAHSLNLTGADRIRKLSKTINAQIDSKRHSNVSFDFDPPINQQTEPDGISLSEDELAEIFSGLDHKYQDGKDVASSVEINILAADYSLNCESARTAVSLWAKTYSSDKSVGERAQMAVLMLKGYEF